MAIASTPTYYLRPDRAELIEQDDEGLLSIWLGEARHDSVRYVTLCRHPDESRIYVERDDQAWSGYDPLQTINLTGQQLTFILNEHGAKQLGIERVVIDGSLLSAAQWRQLTDLIAALCAGLTIKCSLVS